MTNGDRIKNRGKILHILPIPIQPLIGPCLRTLRQGQGARSKGYEVYVLCRKPKKTNSPFPAEDPVFEGINIECALPSLQAAFLRELAHLLFSWFVILGMIRRIRPDIVHVHNHPETIAFVTAIICSLRGIPLIYDVHDGFYENMSSLRVTPFLKRIYIFIGLFFERVSLSRCSGILTVSQSLKDSMLRRAGAYIGGKPFVVMKNVDPRLAELAVDGDENEENYLLYSGTLYTEIIGLEDMAEALKKLNAETGVRLLVAGDGPYRKSLEDYFRKEGIGEAVEFLGHLDRENLYRVIRGSKLCVAPFRRTLQLEVAVPNKLFEYMALGKAIVYPDLPGFREVLGEGNKGMYIPDDKKDMERVIENMMTDNEMRKSAGKRNRELIKQFSFENEFDKLNKLYENVL